MDGDDFMLVSGSCKKSHSVGFSGRVEAAEEGWCELTGVTDVKLSVSFDDGAAIEGSTTADQTTIRITNPAGATKKVSFKIFALQGGKMIHEWTYTF